MVEELGKLGVDDAAIDRILSSMAVTSLEELEALVGTETEAIADMRYLFSLAEGCAALPCPALHVTPFHSVAHEHEHPKTDMEQCF